MLPFLRRRRWRNPRRDEEQAVLGGVGGNGIVKDGLRIVSDGEVFSDGETGVLCEERCEGNNPVKNVMSC